MTLSALSEMVLSELRDFEERSVSECLSVFPWIKRSDEGKIVGFFFEIIDVGDIRNPKVVYEREPRGYDAIVLRYEYEKAMLLLEELEGMDLAGAPALQGLAHKLDGIREARFPS